MARQEPFIGKKLRQQTLTVTEALLDDYYNGLKLERPRDGAVPTTLASGPDGAYFSDIAFSYQVGHLWMRQGWDNVAPLTVGMKYVSDGEIVDIYDHRDRRVVHYVTALRDAGGSTVLRTYHHQSFLREPSSTGSVEFRDPTKKPGARKFVVPEGTRFGGLQRTITVAMCGTFFHGDANYHTDKAQSKALGFRDVVVGGRMTMPLAAHVLEQHFGHAWWTSGKFDLKFTNPVWADDTVTAHGVDTGPLADAAGRRGAFVWVEKADGTIALIMTASVAVG